MTGRPFFFVPGKARPQGSKRAPKAGVVRETTKGLHAWRRAVADTALAAGWRGTPEPGAFAVALIFVRARPKSHYERAGRGGRRADAPRVLLADAPAYPESKPDIDKLERAILDALTGRCWPDDCKVVAIRKWKLYGAEPGVGILVARTAPVRPGAADLPATLNERDRDARLVQVFNWWPASIAPV